MLNIPSEEDVKEVLTLDHDKLPGFPQAAAKLLETAGDETASLQDLQRIMETDPGLSAQTLEIVNSARYGLGRKITTLSDAVVILGLDEIKKQACGMAIYNQMFATGRSVHFDRMFFWRHTLSVALLSREIAVETGYADPEEAYMAGLLHDVGKIFLDLQGKVDYGEFIHSLSAAVDFSIEQERSSLGLGHDDIGAYFCALWQLPEKITTVVKYHHQSFEHLELPARDKALTAIVALSDFICWTQGIGSHEAVLPPVLCPEVVRTIDPDQVDIIRCISAMNREVAEISEFYRFGFPSGSQLKENLLRAGLKLSRLNTRYYFNGDLSGRSGNGALGTEAPQFLESEFGKPLARAKSVKEVLDIVLFQIGRIFQPRNWSILLKDPKSGKLVFSVVVGENKKKLQGMKLPKGEGIAGYVMETGESVIVEDVSADERFSSRVDTYTGFRTLSVIGTPLKTNDKIFGVIQLINRNREGVFSETDMKLLSSIAEYAAIAIERSYYTQALTNLATRDPLTGLKNRWSFERAVANKTDFRIQYGTVFSMLVIRVEGLDGVLRQEGQERHDAALGELVKIMNAIKRRNDTLFRYSERIFLMLLPLTYADGCDTIKTRIESGVSTATAENRLPAISVDMVHQTLSSKEIDAYKKLLMNSLTGAGEPGGKDPAAPVGGSESVADMAGNLQPLVEAEEKKEAAENPGGQFGKSVSLSGFYVHTKSRKSVPIKITQLSMQAVGFTIPSSQALAADAFLDVQFVLDNIKRSVIKRQVVVREITPDCIRAEFYNPPPYDSDLGFYLLN